MSDLLEESTVPSTASGAQPDRRTRRQILPCQDAGPRNRSRDRARERDRPDFHDDLDARIDDERIFSEQLELDRMKRLENEMDFAESCARDAEMRDLNLLNAKDAGYASLSPLRDAPPGLADSQEPSAFTVASQSVLLRTEAETRLQSGIAAADPIYDNGKDEVLMKHLNPDVLKFVNKTANQLKSDVISLQKVNQQLKDVAYNMKELQGGRYPSGTRPFKLPYECLHWETFNASISGTLSFSSDIGTEASPFAIEGSLRDCKEKLYRVHLISQIALDVWCLQCRRTDLRKATKRDVFLKVCTDKYNTLGSMWSRLDLDLTDDDVARGMNIKNFHDFINRKYTFIVDQIASKSQENIETEMRKEKEKQDLISKLSEKTPIERFNTAVDERIKRGKGKSSLNTALYVYHNHVENVSKQDVDALMQKNELSPTTGGGTAKSIAESKPKPNPKSRKGKGKSSRKTGKGKGKGSKSNPPQAGKGKGKGSKKGRNGGRKGSGKKGTGKKGRKGK